MQSIGILYIATGKYIVFWKEFFESFENYFLKDIEKHYYIFTDAQSFEYMENERVHIIYQKEEPWPLPTLLKYHRFLEIEDMLRQHDFLYQSNGPVVCTREVKKEDFLPQQEEGERLFFTIHPGYVGKHPRQYPYDRNRKTKAYVPYNCGEKYVFGAMNGGNAESYIQFMREIDSQIVEDLKQGIIARFHDESYVNHNILLRKDYRILPYEYGYPSNWEISKECYIACVDKEKYLDMTQIKGKRTNKKEQMLDKYVVSPLCWLIDSILRRKVNGK